MAPRFRILGPLEVSGDAGPIPITAGRQQVVLSMLLLEANRIVPADRLVDAVWDTAPPSTARGQLQICVSLLRGILTKAGLAKTILTRPSGYLANVDAEDLDYHVFERLSAEGRSHYAQGRFADAAVTLGEALALWRGEPQTGTRSAALRAAVTRLVEQRLAIAELFVDARLAIGQHHEVVDVLADLVSQHPLREHLRAQLMLALSRSGRQAEALEVYRSIRQTLVEELGIEPGEELRELERAVLNGDVGGSPPPPMSAAVTAVPQLLPGTISDFTGHEELRATLPAVLLGAGDSAPGVRIISISGKAGVGKTTLAVHLGHELAAEFPDGQLFANLRGGSGKPVTATQVLERFLRSLGVAGPDVPPTLDERAEMFRDRVADRRILIVLDDAAGEEHLRWLIPGTSTCAVIVTARSRLTGLAGARSYQLDVFTADQALSLLVRILSYERVYTELADAMRLITLCGGLALALRIAAARLAARPHWAIAQLVERLANERQRLDELIHGGLGVRATLALAYEGLPPAAQRLFRLLGTLESADFASWVAAPLLNVDIAEAEDTIELLVDAQLLDGQRVSNGLIRYRFHDLIRAYSRERLAQQDGIIERGEAMSRFLGTWLFLAEEAHRREYGGDHTLVHGTAPRWPLSAWRVDHELAVPLEWFETERQNLVAAVRQAAGLRLDELCWDLALTSVTLFEARNYFDDWRVTHEVALAAARHSGNRRGEAAMVHSLGTLRLFEHRLDDAADQLALAVRLFGEVGDTHGEALAMRNLAFADRVQGRLDLAWAGFQKALVMVREAGDWTTEAHILSNLAQISLERGQPKEAIDTLHHALRAIERSGNRRVYAQVLCRMGETYLEMADLAAAEHAFRLALAAVHSCSDVVGEAHALYGLGTALSRGGDHAQAASTLTRALSIAGQTGDSLVKGRILLALGELDSAQGQDGLAQIHLSTALGFFTQLGATRWQLRALRALATACAATGNSEAAAAAEAKARTREAELAASAASDSAMKGWR